MALSLKQVARTHGAGASAVTAAGVAFVIVVQQLLEALVTAVVATQYGQTLDAFGSTLAYALLTAVPVGFGFFLSLWLIAPIAAELRIGHVITRAILASGVGASILFIVRAILAIIGGFTPTGSLFGNSFPAYGFDLGLVAGALGSALVGAILVFIALLPLGVLAGILLWLWRKDHPPKQPLAGLIDV